MLLRYIGRAPAVEVDAAGVFVQNGATAEFPDEIATSLLRQRGQWETVAVPKPSKSKITPTPDTEEAG